MPTPTQTNTHPALTAGQIAALSFDERETELKARLGSAHLELYGENRVTLPEVITALQNFVLSQPMGDHTAPAAPSSTELQPAPVAPTPAVAAVPEAKSVTTPSARPEIVQLTGLNRTVAALARRNATSKK